MTEWATVTRVKAHPPGRTRTVRANASGPRRARNRDAEEGRVSKWCINPHQTDIHRAILGWNIGPVGWKGSRDSIVDELKQGPTALLLSETRLPAH